MGDYGFAVGQRQILLDRDREAGLQRALDSVFPLTFVRVTIVSVEHRTVVIQEIQIDLAKKGQAGKQHAKRKSHHPAE
jgi:hypothetical protein